jgi:hypothetical protein
MEIDVWQIGKYQRKIFIAAGAVYLQMFSIVRWKTATLSINFCVGHFA